jgi:ribose 5-phosphate isomerase A
MVELSAVEIAKQAAGRHAAAFVEDGMGVGLGTGSTVRHTIIALGERQPCIRCVATSEQTAVLARDVGLEVVAPEVLGRLDIAVDGADEVDPALNLIKGGGGAHTREKVVAAMAERFVVVVDESKLVDRLGAFGLPIEVIDFAAGVVAARLRDLGAAGVTRRAALSDNGNPILDAAFGEIPDPPALAARLCAIPGVVEHGIFTADMVERVVVSSADARVREIVRES